MSEEPMLAPLPSERVLGRVEKQSAPSTSSAPSICVEVSDDDSEASVGEVQVTAVSSVSQPSLEPPSLTRAMREREEKEHRHSHGFLRLKVVPEEHGGVFAASWVFLC